MSILGEARPAVAQDFEPGIGLSAVSVVAHDIKLLDVSAAKAALGHRQGDRVAPLAEVGFGHGKDGLQVKVVHHGIDVRSNQHDRTLSLPFKKGEEVHVRIFGYPWRHRELHARLGYMLEARNP
jgi:hypothetical protein